MSVTRITVNGRTTEHDTEEGARLYDELLATTRYAGDVERDEHGLPVVLHHPDEDEDERM